MSAIIECTLEILENKKESKQTQEGGPGSGPQANGVPKGYDAAKAKVMTKYGIGDGHQGKSLGDLSKAKYKQFFKDMDKAVAKL